MHWKNRSKIYPLLSTFNHLLRSRPHSSTWPHHNHPNDLTPPKSNHHHTRCKPSNITSTTSKQHKPTTTNRPSKPPNTGKSPKPPHGHPKPYHSTSSTHKPNPTINTNKHHQPTTRSKPHTSDFRERPHSRPKPRLNVPPPHQQQPQHNPLSDLMGNMKRFPIIYNMFMKGRQ